MGGQFVLEARTAGHGRGLRHHRGRPTEEVLSLGIARQDGGGGRPELGACSGKIDGHPQRRGGPADQLQNQRAGARVGDAGGGQQGLGGRRPGEAYIERPAPVARASRLK